MKVVGELKDKVEAAKTKEEAKTVIAEAGIELTDDELDEVAGGVMRGVAARKITTELV